MSNQPLIQVLLVLGREQVTDWLIATLRAEPQIIVAGVVPSLERAAEMIEQRRIDILLIDISVPDAKDLNRLQALAMLPFGPALILSAGVTDMAFVQQAMFAGARGFLLKPFTQTQLLDSVKQTFEILNQHRAALIAPAATSTAHSESADILVLFSPKGGVGCTSLAINLAIALKNESNKPVVLVDGDLQFGDVDIAINVVARKSIADLLVYINDLEPPMIDSVLMDHSSGVQLLLAPPRFDPSLEITESWLSHIISMLSASRSGYILVDAPSGLSEPTLNLLDDAKRVLLVTAPSVSSLRATKRFLDVAVKMDYTNEKIQLVVSGYRKDDIPIDDIERHLDWPLTAVVPGDSLAMALSMNQGQPIVMRDRNHAISKAIIKLARSLHHNSSSGASRSAENDPNNLSPDRSANAASFNRLRPDRLTSS